MTELLTEELAELLEWVFESYFIYRDIKDECLHMQCTFIMFDYLNTELNPNILVLPLQICCHL